MEQGTQRRGTGACTFPVHLDAQRFRLVLECKQIRLVLRVAECSEVVVRVRVRARS